MRSGKSGAIFLLSSMRERCSHLGVSFVPQDPIALRELSDKSCAFRSHSMCRDACSKCTRNKPRRVRLAWLLPFILCLLEVWYLNLATYVAEAPSLCPLLFRAAAAHVGATGDEVYRRKNLQHQYSPAEYHDEKEPKTHRILPSASDGPDATSVVGKYKNTTMGTPKSKNKPPLVPIPGKTPDVIEIWGRNNLKSRQQPEQLTPPFAPLLVPADASDPIPAVSAPTSDPLDSLAPESSTLASEVTYPGASAGGSGSLFTSVLPNITASFPGSFNSFASVAVPFLLTDSLTSFPLFSTVVERKKFAGNACVGLNGCNNSSSKSTVPGFSSNNGSGSNGCGSAPCALEVLSLLDSTSATEWPLMPSIMLQGLGKTVDKVVRGFVLRTAQVLPNIKRNVIISYKGYKPFRLLEMLQLRNHFLEQLSAFFSSLQPLRSIYLRHLGMEIFELPDVLGIADFIRAALGLRQYVEHVYEDQELTDFDLEPAESTNNEEGYPWAAPPSVFPLREGPHRHPTDNIVRQKRHHQTDSPAAGVHGAGSSDDGLAPPEISTPNADTTTAGGWNSHKEERRHTLTNQENISPPVVGDGAPPRRLQVMPNDPLTWRQWPVSDHGRMRWGTEVSKAWELWTGEGLQESITVAVIDSGVNYSHPDLRNMIWRNPDEICNNGLDDDGNGLIDDCIGWDFINGDNDPDDDNGHGTASAGIIAAEPNNHIGMAGICWKCKIMCLKALNQNIKGTVSSFARAIDYAIGKGVKISNNSYGGRGSGFHGLEQAVLRARAAGMIFVAAAGNYNGNNDNDRDPVFPASYPLDNIISVAAITRAGTLANFSSYGRTQVDIAAPGAQIMSTSLHGTYRTLDGTSFAVPFVTGAVALIWSRFPQLTYQEVIARILRNAKPNPNLKGFIATSGVIDIWKALTDGADRIPPSAPSPSLLLRPIPLSTLQPLPPRFLCGTLICHPVASCVMSSAGPLCQCTTGYDGDGLDCRDIDECTFSPCGPASVCKNLPGSFECLCREGFRQVADTCVDIDECSEGVSQGDGKTKQSACPAVALCQNFSGSFECVCPPRSLWNGKSGSQAQCLTLNTPVTGPCIDNGGCGINALCQTSGSAWYHQRTCTCVEGYEKFGPTAQSAALLQQVQLLGDGKEACVRKGLLDLEMSRYLAVWEVFFWPTIQAQNPQRSEGTASSGATPDADRENSSQQAAGPRRSAPAGRAAMAVGKSAAPLPDKQPQAGAPPANTVQPQAGAPPAKTVHTAQEVTGTSTPPAKTVHTAQEVTGKSTSPAKMVHTAQEAPGKSTPPAKTLHMAQEVTGKSETTADSRDSAPAVLAVSPSGSSPAVSSLSAISALNTSTALDETNNSRLASDIVGSFYAAAGWLRPRGHYSSVYNQPLTCFLGFCLVGGTEPTASQHAG